MTEPSIRHGVLNCGTLVRIEDRKHRSGGLIVNPLDEESTDRPFPIWLRNRVVVKANEIAGVAGENDLGRCLDADHYTPIFRKKEWIQNLAKFAFGIAVVVAGFQLMAIL